VQAGGIFVNQEAEKFVSAELSRAKVSDSDITPISEVREQFEMAKMNFADPRKDEIKLRVGMGRMNLTNINVKRGLLTLSG
jgi:hypothetical protein